MVSPTPAAELLAFDAAAFASWLVETSRLADHEKRVAEEVARQNGQTFIRAALDLGLISDPNLADALANWTELPRWSPDGDDAPLTSLAPARFLHASGVLALDDPR